MQLAKGIWQIPFPSVTVKYSPKNIDLAIELEKIKRDIVLKLLPNINDQEAAVALGQKYTAEVVKKRPTPEWFNQ